MQASEVKIEDLALSDILLVEFYDHFTDDNKTSEDIVKPILIVYGAGVLTGIDPVYISISYFYENATSSNNDHLKIIKSTIKRIVKLGTLNELSTNTN